MDLLQKSGKQNAGEVKGKKHLALSIDSAIAKKVIHQPHELERMEFMNVEGIGRVPPMHFAIGGRTDEVPTWAKEALALLKKLPGFGQVLNRFEGYDNVRALPAKAGHHCVADSKVGPAVKRGGKGGGWEVELKAHAGPGPELHQEISPHACAARHIDHQPIPHEFAREQISHFVLVEDPRGCLAGNDSFTRETKFRIAFHREPRGIGKACRAYQNSENSGNAVL